MFNKLVVFVVGAGASCEYKMPLGSDLKSAIAKKVHFRFEYGSRLIDGDHELLDHIRSHARTHERSNAYTRAASRLSEAMELFISIHEALHFLADSPEAVEVGKIGIVTEILAAERRSSLRIDPKTGKVQFNSTNSGWVSEMLSMALAGAQHGQLSDIFRNVAIVNFNYDRCIEHYLYWALQQKAGVNTATAAKIVSGLKMIRPYGSLGKLDWQAAGAGASDGVAYGYEHYLNPVQLSGGIRTYTEHNAVHNAAEIDECLEQARMTVFLGFGFHTQNLKILQIANPAAIERNRSEGVATFVGVNSLNRPAISDGVCAALRLPHDQVKFHDMTSAKMLAELRPYFLSILQ